MNLDIKLHKEDLPDDLKLGNSVSLDCEMGGLNVNRDLLHLVQISTGNSDAHIIQLNRSNYKAPNLIKLLKNKSIRKIFHFARADLAFISRYLKTDVEKIFFLSKMSHKITPGMDKHRENIGRKLPLGTT